MIFFHEMLEIMLQIMDFFADFNKMKGTLSLSCCPRCMVYVWWDYCVYTCVIYGRKLPMHDICHELCPFCSNLRSSLCMSLLDCAYMVSEVYARSLFIGILSWHCNTFIHQPVPKVLISHKISVQRDIIQWIY